MKKIRNKKALIILSIIAVIAVGGALYVKFNQKSASPKTEQEKLQEQQQKATSYDPDTDNEAYYREQQAKQQPQTQSSSNGKATASVYFSSISQGDGNVYINAIVDKQTSGTCTLNLTKSGSQTITRTAPLGMVTSYYACQGFTLKRSEFPSTGDWTAVVSFTNNASEGKTPPETVTIQ